MNKIRQLSKILSYIFCILLIAYPLFQIILWINPLGFAIGEGAVAGKGFGSNVSISALSDIKIFHKLTLTDKVMGFWVQLIPNLLTFGVIYCLFKLFSLYEQGKIFVVDASRYIKKIGFLLLIGNLVRPIIFHPLLQFVMTMNDGVGKRFASISFGTDNLYDILISLLVILVSWIMTEACKINEEQELTV